MLSSIKMQNVSEIYFQNNQITPILVWETTIFYAGFHLVLVVVADNTNTDDERRMSYTSNEDKCSKSPLVCKFNFVAKLLFISI